MTARLDHAIVLMVADDLDVAHDLASALTAHSCTVHHADPGPLKGGERRYDAAVIITQTSCEWAVRLISMLRSADHICASLVLLGSADPDAIAKSVHVGAVDCLARPLHTLTLFESLAGVVDCSRRWRARVSHANAAGASVDADEVPMLGRISTGLDDRVDSVVQRFSERGSLTPREEQVLYWLLRGLRYVDIASILDIRQRTVKFHVRNVMDKLEVDTRHDLSRLLLEVA
jgi:DNA-binding CsgD family transcriptional regulator/ActR/RegA family two-component response regulator